MKVGPLGALGCDPFIAGDVLVMEIADSAVGKAGKRKRYR